ncbi:MAG: hypothetical protein EA425_11170 [Puniceicoccaceae bacterium]|nr:MAG: hypothetical protein EA425_11170 [Puniceicoccaceae bacterium]
MLRFFYNLGKRLSRQRGACAPVIALVFATQLFDAAATHWSVGVAGYAREANPLMDWVIIQIGWSALYAIKLSLAGILAVLLHRCWERPLAPLAGLIAVAATAVFGGLTHLALFALHLLH